MRRIHLSRGAELPSPPERMRPGAALASWMENSSERRQDVAATLPPLILVIDDSATVRKIVETCLSREGFEVKGFEDGVEALRWLILPEARVPDMVLLDISLPKMDGYEVAHRLKAKPLFVNTVIVLLTRRDSVIDKLKGRLAGARDYITKPFKTQDMIAIVNAYVSVPCHEQKTVNVQKSKEP